MSQKLGEAYYFLLDKIYCLRLRGSFYYKKFSPEANKNCFGRVISEKTLCSSRLVWLLVLSTYSKISIPRNLWHDEICSCDSSV